MKYLPLIIVLIYLLIMNIIAYCVSYVDKKRAVKDKKHRISEKCLFTLAFIGGALGEYISMKHFHHKTFHKRFMIGLPLIMLLHIGLAVGIIFLMVNVFNYKLW